MIGSKLRVAAVGSLLVLAGAACGGGGGNSVSATLSDFKIDLGSTTADAGEVTFEIKNDGPSAHEFVVFRTDLAPDQLPTKEESGAVIVDEEGEGVEAVDEVEDIEPGSSPELKVTLEAGSYVVICNLPAHYEQGMHAALTVSG
jgi:uncharacterized cupredoxin-like copper-binding protein